MAKAVWNNQVIAESEKYVSLEGNVYFPVESVNKEFLKESDLHTVCPWKGTASYYSIEVNGEINEDAAWYYPTPSDASKHIKDHIAFWKGVEVTK